MNRSKSIRTAFVLLALTAIATVAAAEESRPTVRIGILADGPRPRGYDIVEVVREEILEVVGASYDVEFPEDAILDGGWTHEGARAATSAMLRRTDIDLALAVGVEVAAAACAFPDPAMPVVVPFALPACGTQCPRSADIRINSLDMGRLMMRDLHALHDVVPFTEVAILTDPGWIATCDTEHWSETIAPEGTTVRFVVVEPGDTDLVPDLPEGTDAVYLTRVQSVDDDGFAELVRGLTRAGYPTFSLLGALEVEEGVLAGLNTPATVRTLARGAAVDVLDLLDGREDDPAPLLDYGTRLTVNMATAAELGVGLSWEVLSDAELLRQDVARRGEPIDLSQTLRRAETANLDLLVEDRVVTAGAEDIRSAKANYRPRLDVAVQGAAIDADRAVPLFGQYERFASGSLELTQLIYSDDASANIKVQKELQRARGSDRETVRLDIARTAAAAYLDLMRSEALVRIRQDDLNLNRANLDVARLRHSVGVAGKSEIYRWEAEVAAARAAVLEALAVRRLSERQLSRLLDRPVTLQWDPLAPGVAQGLDILGGAGEAALLDTPNGFERLVDLLLGRGLEASPELAAIDAGIAAQQRALVAAKRARYVPQVAANAGIEQIALKALEDGSGPPGVDDTLWNIGVGASLPLYAGGAIKARRIRTSEELLGLRLQRRNIDLRVSQRILSALDRAAASWPAITLRRLSADAAAQTLELVQDSYARGAASILDLLDAQNAALTADFAAETAVYVFLDDWAEVRRSIGEL